MIDYSVVDEPIVDLPSQAALLRAAFEGQDVAPMIQSQLDLLHADPTDASAYISLSLLYQLIGQKQNGLACQDAGLHYARLYRQPVVGATLRLLAIVARGDLMTNTPVELLLEGSGVEVSRLYVDELGGLTDSAPDHDIALMSIGEDDATRAALERLKGLGPIGLEREPHLQGAEAPRQVRTEVAGPLPARGDAPRLAAQIGRAGGEGGPLALPVAHQDIAGVIGRLAPFVKIEGDGVGPLDAVQQRRQFGRQPR